MGRCAYDHLTATYLLLGEHLRQTRHSLPQTLAPRPTEIGALVEAQFSDRNSRPPPAASVEIQASIPVLNQQQPMPRSSCPNERAMDHSRHFSMKDTNLMNVIFPPRTKPQHQKSYRSQQHGLHSGHSALNRTLPRVSEPVTVVENKDNTNFFSIPQEDALMLPPSSAEFHLNSRGIGPHTNHTTSPFQPPINLSCRSVKPHPSPPSHCQSTSVAPSESFDWWFPDPPEMMCTENSHSTSHEPTFSQVKNLISMNPQLTTSAHFNGQPLFTLTDAGDLQQTSSSRLLPLSNERRCSNESKDSGVGYLPPNSLNRACFTRPLGRNGFAHADAFGKSITDEYTSGLGSSEEAGSWNSSLSMLPRCGTVSLESGYEDMGIDIPNTSANRFSFVNSRSPAFSPLMTEIQSPFSHSSFTPQEPIPDTGSSHQPQLQSPIPSMPEYLQNMARRKFGVSSRPLALQEHLQKFQQINTPMEMSLHSE